MTQKLPPTRRLLICEFQLTYTGTTELHTHEHLDHWKSCYGVDAAAAWSYAASQVHRIRSHLRSVMRLPSLMRRIHAWFRTPSWTYCIPCAANLHLFLTGSIQCVCQGFGRHIWGVVKSKLHSHHYIRSHTPRGWGDIHQRIFPSHTLLVRRKPALRTLRISNQHPPHGVYLRTMRPGAGDPRCIHSQVTTTSLLGVSTPLPIHYCAPFAHHCLHTKLFYVGSHGVCSEKSTVQEDASHSDASRQEHEKVIKKLRSELSVASEQLGGMQSDVASRIEETRAAQQATREAAQQAQALQVTSLPSFLPICANCATAAQRCIAMGLLVQIANQLRQASAFQKAGRALRESSVLVGVPQPVSLICPDACLQ